MCYFEKQSLKHDFTRFVYSVTQYALCCVFGNSSYLHFCYFKEIPINTNLWMTTSQSNMHCGVPETKNLQKSPVFFRWIFTKGRKWFLVRKHWNFRLNVETGEYYVLYSLHFISINYSRFFKFLTFFLNFMSKSTGNYKYINIDKNICFRFLSHTLR